LSWLAAVVVLVGVRAMWVRQEPSSAQARASQVLVIGDSLAVGLKPFLPAVLAGDALTWDTRSGRTTPEGMRALRGALRRVRPQTVIISLGTNDGPDPQQFKDRLRRVLRAVPVEACVVWAAIVRPPRKGPYRALNWVLRAEAARDARFTVVDWDAAVSSHKLVLPDGVHPDRLGFWYRSRMIATAVKRGCGAT
jgi:lysophospholipase L1-like esterase